MTGLQPGPELDRLIAEQVMGWTHWLTSYGGEFWLDGTKPVRAANLRTTEMSPWFLPQFQPSTNMAHAWEVVAEIIRKNPSLVIQTNTDAHGTMCRIITASGDSPASCVRKSAPHAICLAALRAVGADTQG
jgi:hypothetical protein